MFRIDIATSGNSSAACLHRTYAFMMHQWAPKHSCHLCHVSCRSCNRRKFLWMHQWAPFFLVADRTKRNNKKSKEDGDEAVWRVVARAHCARCPRPRHLTTTYILEWASERRHTRGIHSLGIVWHTWGHTRAHFTLRAYLRLYFGVLEAYFGTFLRELYLR